MDKKHSRLLSELIEHRLDPSEIAALSEQISADPELQTEYAWFLQLHADLADMHAPPRPFSMEELRAIAAVESCVDALVEGEPAPTVRPRRRGDRITTGIIGLLLGAAASALIAIFVLGKGQAPFVQPNAELPSTASNAATSEKPIARIVRKVDCELENDRWDIAPTADIFAGQQIELKSGLLVIEFACGAEITLDGQAKLVASDEKNAKLLMGKLTAHVPPSGRGFTVETPAGDFIDLGTEFGMIVSEEGDVETHVFRGEVIASPISMDGQRQEQLLLEAGAAWTRSAMAATGTTASAQPEFFVRPLQRTESPTARPPRADDLVLWLNAGLHVQLDQHGAVSAWGSSTGGTDEPWLSAWQFAESSRPKVIREGVGEKPGLRFEGNDALITEPLELGANQTAAVVFEFDPVAAKRVFDERPSNTRYLGVQLLNLNGPPHFVMQMNDDGRLEARVHQGMLRNHFDPVEVGFTISPKPLSPGPHVALYTYNSDKSLAQLYIDGRLEAESLYVPKIETRTSSRWVGGHHNREGFGFTGQIAEVLLYDAALTPEESRSTSMWLGRKYGIGQQSAADDGGANEMSPL